MRWLCDEMLGRLARLLRAAGHDTLMAGGATPDDAVLAQARREGRILLTRDRRLAEAAGGDAHRLAAASVEEQALALAAALPVDWLLAPYTRCLMDNTPLRPAQAAEVAAMPAAAREGSGPFNACPACRRLYWPGSHVRRLADRLQELARAGAAPGARPEQRTGETP